jgi:hypothetical protein
MSIGQVIMLAICIAILILTALQGKAIYNAFYKNGSNKPIFYLYLVSEFLTILVVAFIITAVLNKGVINALFQSRIP